jgi:ATP-dependent helicase HrpA
VDQKNAAGLRLFETAPAAQVSTRGGVRRLLLIDLADDLRRLIHGNPTVERVCVQFSTMGSAMLLKQSLVELIADRAMGGQPLPRSHEAYEQMRRVTQMSLGNAAKEAIELVDRVMQSFYASQLRLSGKQPEAWTQPVREIREQLTHMFGQGFLVATPWKWLQQYPRYLAAIDARIAKLSGPGVLKDERARAEFAPLWRAYLDLAKRGRELGLDQGKIDEYRWTLEELRVSLFAQELRTIVPVSVKRLQDMWTAVVKG